MSTRLRRSPTRYPTSAADTAAVDTVLVAGEIQKRHGELVGVGLARLRTPAGNSRGALQARTPVAPVAAGSR